MLLEADGEIGLSVSVTTRPKRPGEVDGKDYHFVDKPDFRPQGTRPTNSSNGPRSSATSTEPRKPRSRQA